VIIYTLLLEHKVHHHKKTVIKKQQVKKDSSMVPVMIGAGAVLAVGGLAAYMLLCKKNQCCDKAECKEKCICENSVSSQQSLPDKLKLKMKNLKASAPFLKKTEDSSIEGGSDDPIVETTATKTTSRGLHPKLSTKIMQWRAKLQNVVDEDLPKKMDELKQKKKLRKQFGVGENKANEDKIIINPKRKPRKVIPAENRYPTYL